MPIGPRDSLDLVTLSEKYASGEWTPAAVLAEVQRRINAYPDPAVWITRLPQASIDAQLTLANDRAKQGIAQPLLGVPFAVKDNIDVAGVPTTAACPAFAYTPEHSSTVVELLCSAGAIVVGKTNLDQFATGLVGTRSPYGVCQNTFNPRYISGGSSSGSAVAVAAGLVSFSLGTDTAGSGRVPAAFNNLVGWKPTRGLLSNRGLFPACRSLDCISIFTLTCAEAQRIANIVACFDPADPYSREQVPAAVFKLQGLRLGVPAAGLKFFGDAESEKLFYQAVEKLVAAGASVTNFDYTPFNETASLLYNGPWVAERYLGIKDLIMTRPETLLPVTRSIIERGATFDAADTFLAFETLAELKRQTATTWKSIDVMLVPTTGTIYTISDVLNDPVELNSNLGYYTNFVNLLDLSALAVPNAFRGDGLPTGITFIAPAGADRSLLDLGDFWQRATGKTLGATGNLIPSQKAAVQSTSQSASNLSSGKVRIAVVGAHLSGMPLNGQLTDRGGTLVSATRTAPLYRLYAMPGTVPPKPGLLRVDSGDGVAVEIEVWELSNEAFGSFVAAIPSPLGIGTLALEDGQSVHGFLAESFAVKDALDISRFGGWRKYIASQKK